MQLKSIDRSVKNLIFSKKRKCQTVQAVNKSKYPHIDLKTINDFNDIVAFYQQISAYSMAPEDFFNPNQIFHQLPAITLTTLQQNIRSGFSSSQLVKTIRKHSEQTQNDDLLNKQNEAKDLQEMDSGVKTFICNLMNYK